MEKRLFLFLSLIYLFLPIFASAQSVTYFSASPTSFISGAQVDFAWTLGNAGGYSFLVTCAPGIKLKYASGGIFPCDTRVSSVVKTNDLIRLIIANVSGGSRTINTKVIPKDGSGQDQDSNAQSVSLSVTTNPQPIAAFSTSATTTVAGQPTTLSWTTQDLEGVNLQVECRDEIKITSSSYTGFLPCGQPIFTTDLGPSSSLSLNFTNSANATLPYKITLLPSITPQSYDGTHTAALTLNIASDILKDPIINSFGASTTIVNSGDPLQISWGASHTQGTNLKISCANLLTATSSKNPSTILPCGDTFIFSDTMGATSTLTFYFQNKDTGNSNVTLTLIPEKKAGEYDATRAKNINLIIKPVPPQSSAIAPTPLPLPPPSLAPSSTTTPKPPPPNLAGSTLSPPSTSPKPKFIFSTFLKRGSQGNSVSVLQQFLKKDITIYPEGLLTGFFGPATERAVKRFQEKYDIARPGIAGYGTVGPKTRAKLNELQ